MATRPNATKPRRKSAKKTALARLREICLALPEAHEVEAWGEPTFRVRNKLFAMHSSADTHHGAGREGVWIASTRLSQDLVLRAKPTRSFSPPYVGPSGWIGAWLDGNPPWSEIAELLRDAYRLKAPKRLARTLDE
jgi:predicted DNA-binding protein (MmcQ/YjbR family)